MNFDFVKKNCSQGNTIFRTDENVKYLFIGWDATKDMVCQEINDDERYILLGWPEKDIENWVVDTNEVKINIGQHGFNVEEIKNNIFRILESEKRLDYLSTELFNIDVEFSEDKKHVIVPMDLWDKVVNVIGADYIDILEGNL